MQLLTVVNFAAGGVATPADEALMMRLGDDGVFTGSGIFKAENPEKMANAVVEAVNNYDNPSKIAEISKGVGAGMKSISEDMVPVQEALQKPDDKSHNPFSHIDYVINY